MERIKTKETKMFLFMGYVYCRSLP